jgi:exopolyphosphatase/guanosine-5'-triphosphate,3'-diphosphate pyrophosphatase
MILTLLLSSVLAFSETAHEARAIVDLGSGTIKLGLFEVEPGQKIVAEWPESVSAPLALEAQKTDDGAISADSQAEALKILKTMRDKAIAAARAHGFKSISLTVVGTHALRTATNKEAVIASFTKAGFPTRAISQEEEARAGYHGVAATHMPDKCSMKSLVVWDVGGGSMQLTRDGRDKENFVGLQIGAEGFKDKAMELKKNPSPDPSCIASQDSPNPLGKENLLALKTAAKREAAQVFKNKKIWPFTCVVGIGGVHTKAIESQINKNWAGIKSCVCGQTACAHERDSYTRKELGCLSQVLAAKNDCDPAIKGPYSKTSVTNLVLILGFMEKLNIEKVKTAAVNMGPHFALENDPAHFAPLAVH